MNTLASTSEHMQVLNRDFQFDGADSDFIYFTARSRSEEEGPTHTVTICKRTGIISCTCKDCMFRKKKYSILNPLAQRCWHQRRILQSADYLKAFFGVE